MQDDLQGYSNAEVVVKLAGWDPTYSKPVAQAALSALKQLILSDKNLTGTLVFLVLALTSWYNFKKFSFSFGSLQVCTTTIPQYT